MKSTRAGRPRWYRTRLLSGIAAVAATAAALLAPVTAADSAAAWVPRPEERRCTQLPPAQNRTFYIQTQGVADSVLPALRRAASGWDAWSNSTSVSIKTIENLADVPSGGQPVIVEMQGGPSTVWASAGALCTRANSSYAGGKLKIYGDVLGTQSEAFKEATLSHEIGHILGLFHTDGQPHCSSNMDASGSEATLCRRGTPPYIDDVAGVYALWRPLAEQSFPAESRIKADWDGRFLKASAPGSMGSWNSLRFEEPDESGLFDWTYLPDKDQRWGWLVNDQTGMCATSYSSQVFGGSVYSGFCDNDNARWKAAGVLGDKGTRLLNKATTKCLGSDPSTYYAYPNVACLGVRSWLTVDRNPSARVNVPYTPRRSIVGEQSQRCITHGGSSISRGRLSIRDCDLVLKDEADNWALHPVEGGYVLGVHESQTPDATEEDPVSAEECATASGQVVELQTCTGSAAQTWALNTNGTIRNSATGTCLHVSGNATANDSPLDVTACGTAPSMVWSIAKEFEVDPMSLAPVSSASGSVLGTAPAPSGIADQRVRGVLTKSTTSGSARWKYFPIAGTHGGLLKNLETGTCLRWKARGEQTALDQACDGSDPSYRWGPTQTKEGNWIIQSQQTGECLDVWASSDSEGAIIGTYSCNYDRNQQWRSTVNLPPVPPATNAPSIGGNLAMFGVASQSSDYGPSFTAGLGNDGRVDDRLTHTYPEANPWWQVDLGRSTSIGAITIYNRTDCCAERSKNIWIMASNSPFPAAGGPQSIAALPGVVSTNSTTNTESALGWSPPPGNYRYVRVQLGIAAPLSLREVTITP